MQKNATKRIVINSISLYANMVITMVVSLIGTRIALNALGEEKYAVYALVANIVALFSFLNVAMAGATQRYLSYSLGTNDKDKVKDIFYNSTVIHFVIASVSATTILALGIPAIKNWLEIPQNMHFEAIVILLTIVCGVIFTIFSVPFEAAMNAHEDISPIAIINILEASWKLSAAIAIIFIEQNKLIIYSVIVMTAFIVSYSCKRIFCKKKYEETHFKWKKINDTTLLKQMTRYAGWNLIGNGCSIVRYQGVSIILNLFYKLTYNAGYGIAQQFNGFLLFFTNSIVRPMRPHIIKNEGAGRHAQMIKHSMTTSKFTTLMLAFIMIPLYINMPYILKIWLNDAPEGALTFCRGFLIITIISQLTVGQQIALESVGRIKKQHIILGAMHLTPLIASVILLYFKAPYQSIIYCIIIEEILNIGIRTIIAKKDADSPITVFVKEILIPCCSSIIICFLVTYFVAITIDNDIIRLIISTLTSCLSLGICSGKICLNNWEKEKIYSLLRKRST